MPTQRINTLRDRALRFRRMPNVEWDQFYRESYARTEGVPEPLRTAKALDHCFRNCQVLIHDQELIVGDAGPEVADEAAQVGPRFIFGHRDWQSPPWWPMAEELKAFFRAGLFGPAGNHTTMDYGTVDQGRILRHGDGPDGCDALVMRQAIAYESGGVYHLYYDACESMSGYFHTCLATSRDLVHWDLKGPANRAGSSGAPDWAGVASPWFIFDGREWHMFYIGTNTRGSKGWEAFSGPYLTMKARSSSLAGPWTKQYDVTPFLPKPDTYYGANASPGHIVKSDNEFLMFFSPQAVVWGGVLRSLGIARTRDLNGPWTVDPEPIVPMTEQIENSSLYYEEANGTWFLFTNHIGCSAGPEREDYTDAVWVYWSKDLNHWDPRHKAVVIDSQNCTWASGNIGMASVVKVGNRLAVFYDAREGSEINHFHRDIGLAWLDLPLIPPEP